MNENYKLRVLRLFIVISGISIIFNISCGYTRIVRSDVLQQFDILKPKLVKVVDRVTEIDFKGETVILDSFIVLNNIDRVTVKNIKLVSTNPKGYIHVKNSKNLIFENLIFDGNRSNKNRFALKVSDSNKILINGCSFENYGLSSDRFEALVIKNSPETIISHCLFKNLHTEKVTRGIKISDNNEFIGSQNSIIKYCKFEDIGPHKDGDAIFIESPKPNLNISVNNNDFHNIAKRYIKVNASNVNIEYNQGENDSEKPMFAFISLFGDNILIKDNIFTTLNGIAFHGITSGNPINKIQMNITVKNNSFVNKTLKYKMRSSALKISTDTKGINITNNTFEGFYFSLTSDFKSKNKVTDIIFKNNKVKCIYGIKFHGATENLRIKN